MNYIIKGLKVIMINIKNYQMLKNISTIKKCKPKNLKLEDYDRWFTEKELDDEEKLGNMPPLECGGEVKGEK